MSLFLFSLLIHSSTNAQSISINTSGAIPDSSAMLDIIAADKGLLIPRVSLNSITDSVTIVHPAISLQVYNTNNSMSGGEIGFWSWTGSRWIQIIGSLGADSLAIDSSITTPLIVGGTAANSSITYRTTSASSGTSGSDHVFKVGNTETMRILHNGNVGINNSTPADMLNITHTDGTKKALSISSTISTSATAPRGFQNTYNITPTGDMNFIGTNTDVSVYGTQTITSTTLGAMGSRVTNTNFSSSGTITNLTSLNLNTNNNSTGTVTNINGLHIRNSGNTGGGTVNNVYGIRIENQTTNGATLIAGYHSAIASGTGKYGLYFPGTAQNYIEGSVGIGTNAPDEKLEITDGNVLLTDNYALNWGNPTKPRGSLRTFSSSPYRGMRYYARCQGVGWEGVHDFYTQIDTATDVLSMRIVNGRVGIGTTSPSAKLHSLATTEQLRLGYDASNYYSSTVGSSGAVTFDATGSGAAFSFSDAVSITSSTPAMNDSTTKVATTAFVDRAVASVAGGSTITNDAATNATMYPVWVTANSGSLPLKVSSTKLSFNPSTGSLTATGDASINTLTVGLGAGSVSTNTVLGYQALNTNSSGGNITATGHQALYSNTASNNTAVGYRALYSNTSGNTNSAVGVQALYSNTTASSNTANGYQALYTNTTGSQNTASGTQALYANTTASYNTAHGYRALYSNTTGNLSTAVGTNALTSNTTGVQNAADGAEALKFNTTGECNTGMGVYSLNFNTTGNNNTGCGRYSLKNNQTGSENTAVGQSALSGTTATGSTALGYSAGSNNTTGTYNTYIGYSANAGANNYTNSSAIGANASVNASNKIRLGDGNITVIEGQVAFTNVSDGRFKKNINENDVKGLDFIMRLRPVSYNVDTRQFEEFLMKNQPDSVKIRHFRDKDFTVSTNIRHSGFVAQEVEQAAQATGFNFTGLHKPETEDDNYGLAYSEFVVPLVKGMQEQQQIIEDLKAQVEKLKTDLLQLQNKQKQQD
ncbi:MAG: tail fiber domain-containing protein [Bacteroidia bacterium]